MPTYEYRCKDCGTTLEAFQSFTDPSLTECQECGGRLRKLFGNVGISFKGSGFYKTDSRSGNGASKANEGSEKDDKSGSESSTKDSKASKDGKATKSGDGSGSTGSTSTSGSGSTSDSGSKAASSPSTTSN